MGPEAVGHRRRLAGWRPGLPASKNTATHPAANNPCTTAAARPGSKVGDGNIVDGQGIKVQCEQTVVTNAQRLLYLFRHPAERTFLLLVVRDGEETGYGQGTRRLEVPGPPPLGPAPIPEDLPASGSPPPE